MNPLNPSPSIDLPDWRAIVARYRGSALGHSIWQLANSLVPFLALLVLMYWSLRWSYLVTLLLAIPAAGFSVRLFIISHDCGHQSFFKSRRLNDFWGEVTALLVWTPYTYWKQEHARHHSTAGNLDRRGVGDIWTLTVSEYMAKPRIVRLLYRLYRNPIVLFGLGPIFLFTIGYRHWSAWAGRTERLSILRTNLFLAMVLVLCHYTIGLKAFLMIELPVTLLGSTAGVWLFYVQHQFEDVYWEENGRWDFFAQAIEGSSCYRLPRVLQWFSGNIGFHHVHHLSPRIPNYRLERCHRENPVFHRARELTLWTSLKSLGFRLWDERSRKMVGFRAIRAMASVPTAGDRT
jgi:omega-6 fatty acid desaturase (delta-12 desaturase)